MKFTRLAGCFLVCLGLLMAGSALRGWITGVIDHSGGKNTSPRMVYRDHEPKLFHAAVSGSAIRGGVLLITGLALLALVRRLDRVDPMSPRFGGKNSLDELNAHLDREHRLRNLPAPKVGRPPE